jgi:hypothetical protein
MVCACVCVCVCVPARVLCLTCTCATYVCGGLLPVLLPASWRQKVKVSTHVHVHVAAPVQLCTCHHVVNALCTHDTGHLIAHTAHSFRPHRPLLGTRFSLLVSGRRLATRRWRSTMCCTYCPATTTICKLQHDCSMLHTLASLVRMQHMLPIRSMRAIRLVHRARPPLSAHAHVCTQHSHSPLC